MTAETATALNQIAEYRQRSTDIAQSAFEGESWGIGTIPWNSTTLPLLSPNGRWIATSSGATPSNASRLALPDAEIPKGAQIEIWELLPGRSGLRAQHTITGSILLTDSADDEGFLIESPRGDGSRWIGKIDWRTGALTWLVQDDQVNTMPTVGPRGRLAWCVRGPHETDLSLAIRFEDEREFVLPGNGSEWLLPMWSDRSTRLSAWRLSSDDVMTLVSLNGESPDSLKAGIKQVFIMNGANRWDAIRATAHRTAIQGLPPSMLEEIVFYHPLDQRMAVWMPLGLNSDRVVRLAPESIDAVHDHPGSFLLTMPKGLHWQDFSSLNRIVRVDHVPLYARPTTDPMRPYVLLDPAAHVVRVRAMRGTSQRSKANASTAEAIEE